MPNATATAVSVIPAAATTIEGRLPSFISGDPREQVFMRYGEGRGTVRPDGRGLSVALNLFTIEGHSDGQQLLSGEVTARTVDDLTTPPEPQTVRFGETGPIPEVPVTCRCKATWTFQDGSSISAIGKGTSHIVPLQPLATSFAAGVGVQRAGVMADKSAMIITAGTGRFTGARGTVTVDSSTFLPDLDNGVFGHPGAEVNQKSVHIFRVYDAKNVAATAAGAV